MNVSLRFTRLVIAIMLVFGMAVLSGCVGEQGAALQSPNEPSSGGLVEEPKRWDGEQVTFTGEAIGERMKRGDGAWLHLNDDAYMRENVEQGAALGGYNSGMPVWFEDAALTGGIDVYGDYKHEGDVVTVTGVFNAACAQHGGDMDIHAETGEVTHEGKRASDPVKLWKIVLALLLSASAAVFWTVLRRVERRERVGF